MTAAEEGRIYSAAYGRAAADPYWQHNNQPGAPPLPGQDEWDDFLEYGLEY